STSKLKVSCEKPSVLRSSRSTRGERYSGRRARKNCSSRATSVWSSMGGAARRIARAATPAQASGPSGRGTTSGRRDRGRRDAHLPAHPARGELREGLADARDRARRRGSAHGDDELGGGAGGTRVLGDALYRVRRERLDALDGAATGRGDAGDHRDRV